MPSNERHFEAVMACSTDRPCPPAALAFRQYQVQLESGRHVTIGLALADPADQTIAEIRRKHDASHLGFLVILDDPDSLEEVVLWFQQAASLTLMSQNGAMLLSDEITDLLPRYFTVFFDEIKDIAPDLAAVLLARVPKTGETHLN
jgi:hypothetical protein